MALSMPEMQNMTRGLKSTQSLKKTVIKKINNSNVVHEVRSKCINNSNVVHEVRSKC